MCTVNDDYDQSQFFVEQKFQIPEDAVCQKCNSERAFVVLRGKDVYCNGCFLLGATHKFRATLGKSKVVRPADKILVAHSGAGSSIALLHLIRAGMHESVHKKLVFETKVVFIDDGAAIEHSLDQRTTKIEEVIDQTTPLGFPTFGLTLSEGLDDEELNIRSLESLAGSLVAFSSSDAELSSILSKLAEQTSKIELIKKLRRRLIVKAARTLGCNKVFLADCSTSLAIDVLSNISLGRGAQLASDVAFLDERLSNVAILRPMRDFARHEIQTYLNLHSLKSVESCDSSNPTSSIQGITERFVTDLESQFSGTVSTIFRTAEKLSAGSTRDSLEENDCALCNSPLDTFTSDSTTSAIRATAFSRLMSTQGSNADLEKMNEKIGDLAVSTDSSGSSSACGKCDKDRCCKTSAKNQITTEIVEKFLCYGCAIIFRNSSIEDVPNWILENVKRRLSLNSMREEITDFLL